MNDLWEIIFTQQPGQGCLGCFGVPILLEENALHKTVLVHGPPKPMSNTVYARPYLIEMPPGTPTGFPVAQVLSKEGPEFDAPFAESLMPHILSRAGGVLFARPGYSGESGGTASGCAE